MELRHLRYFVAVAEEENVSRAALKLHVSQPALSRQVRDLEEELGFPLLERSAKSVRLTDAGRAFLEESGAVLERVEQAVAKAREVATRGREELHVGYAPSLTARVLPPTLRGFQAARPGVRVLLHDLSTEEMLTQVREEKLQIAFVVRPSRAMLRGIHFEDLLTDVMMLAVAPQHPWAARKSIPVREAAQEPLVIYDRKEYPEYYASLPEIFGVARQKLRIAEEHDSVTSMIAGIEAGGGVAIVSASISCFSSGRLKLLPLTPKPKPIVVGAAWPERGLTSDAERFLNLAKEFA